MTRYLHDPANPSSLNHDEIWSIGEDGNGTLWVGTIGGLNRYDPANDAFTPVDLEPPPDATRPDAVAAIHEDRGGTLWAGTAAGLVELRHDGARIRHVHDPDDPVSLSHSFVLNILEDENNELWVGTQGGLNRFDRDTRTFERYLADPSAPSSLSSNRSSSISLHRARATWWHRSIGRSNRATST